MNTSILVDSLIKNPNKHSCDSDFYKEHEESLLEMLKISNLNNGKPGKDSLLPFGDLDFPYREMGAINTLHLFGLDELIIFSYYWANKFRYKKVADLGANIGLHSIILSKFGYNVTSYEPDPIHFDKLIQNANLNNVSNINWINER